MDISTTPSTVVETGTINSQIPTPNKGRKTLKSILRLLLLLIIGCGFLYGYIAHRFPEYQPSMDRFKPNSCMHLQTEAACSQKVECTSVVGPSSCSGNTCTSDQRFYECIEKSKTELEAYLINEKICTDSKGTWHTNYCSCPNGYEPGNSGKCISDKTLSTFKKYCIDSLGDRQGNSCSCKTEGKGPYMCMTEKSRAKYKKSCADVGGEWINTEYRCDCGQGFRVGMPDPYDPESSFTCVPNS